MTNINSYMSAIVVLEYLKIIKDSYYKKDISYSKQTLVKCLVRRISVILQNPKHLDLCKNENLFQGLENHILNTIVSLSDNKLTPVNTDLDDIIDLVSNETTVEKIPIKHNVDSASTNNVEGSAIIVKIENPYVMVRRSGRLKALPNYYGFD